MIARLLIATLLTLTTLTSVAMVQPARDCRRHLLLFTDLATCAPCRLFDRDYKSNPHFSAALNRHYRLHQPYTPQRDLEKFRQHNVTQTPTWLIVDDAGRELGRVSGYAGPKDFWERLILATPVNSPKQRPPAAAAPSPGQQNISNRLRDANRALEAERDNLASRIRTLEQDLSAARARGGTAPTADCEERVASLQAQLAAARSAHEKLQLQLRDETAALREQIRRASQTAANAQAETEKLQKRMQLPDAKPYQTLPKPAPDDDWLEQAMQEAEQQTKPAAPEVPAAAPEPMSGVAPGAVSGPALQSAPHTQSEHPPADANSSIADSGDRWLTLIRSAGKAVVAVAAPELVIPVAVAAGAVALYRKKKTRIAVSESDSVHADHLPRDNSEIEQILSLRQQEQREPIHDAFFGVLFEDEYRSDPDQPIRQAWTNALDRFNRTAPLSTRTETSTSTTSRKE